jgi:hypothetical protein
LPLHPPFIFFFPFCPFPAIFLPPPSFFYGGLIGLFVTLCGFGL